MEMVQGFHRVLWWIYQLETMKKAATYFFPSSSSGIEVKVSTQKITKWPTPLRSLQVENRLSSMENVGKKIHTL